MNFVQKYTSPPSKGRGLNLKPSKIHQQPLHKQGVNIKKTSFWRRYPPFDYSLTNHFVQWRSP